MESKLRRRGRHGEERGGVQREVGRSEIRVPCCSSFAVRLSSPHEEAYCVLSLGYPDSRLVPVSFITRHNSKGVRKLFPILGSSKYIHIEYKAVTGRRSEEGSQRPLGPHLPLDPTWLLTMPPSSSMFALLTFLILQFLFRFLPGQSLKLWVDRSRFLWKFLLDVSWLLYLGHSSSHLFLGV